MKALRTRLEHAVPSSLTNRGLRALVVGLLVVPACGIYLCAEGKDATPSAAGRDPERSVSIAALQAGLHYSFQGNNPGLEANFALFAKLTRQAAAASPRPGLICWPEYAISGWPYPREEVINGLAESIPGEGQWYRRYRDLARELGVPILGWLVESAEGKLYSTALLLDGKGDFKGKYRKVQANLGEQTWWGWSQGERFELIELDGVRYGVSICADMWFPETVRCQELLGADVVVHLSIADDMGHLIPARAFDSKLPIVATLFQGGSYAVDADGKLLGKLPPEEPGWKVFQIYPFRKHLFHKYDGVWDVKKGQQNLRNVGAYSILTDPSTRPPWTEVFMDNAGRAQTREQLLQRFHGRYDARDPVPSGPTTPRATEPGTATTKLGISGTQFTLDGTPAFLYGISYYGALGAPEASIRHDLADLREHSLNWIRVWAAWGAFGHDVSAMDGKGNPREPFLTKLKWLLAECDRAGVVVDVTLSRGNGVTGAACLQTLDAHRHAVETLTTTLRQYRNWYLDLANERNVRDQRFVSFEELRQLRDAVKRLDPRRLVTASASDDIPRNDLREYLLTAQVDFVCPHRPRNRESPVQTEAKSREYLAWMKDFGRVVPVHYQEPFRRGYGKWTPKARDYVTDACGAKAGGAAGWCFHNGDEKEEADSHPRRSFDLREKRLFEQLDQEELKAIRDVRDSFSKR
jgi:predicted amidohydrolase